MNETYIPIQQVIFILNTGRDHEREHLGASVREFQWTGQKANETLDPLLLMLQHRAQRRGVIDDLWPVYLPAMAELAQAAQGSPKRMALLWRHIYRKSDSNNALTEEMVEYAERLL